MCSLAEVQHGYQGQAKLSELYLFYLGYLFIETYARAKIGDIMLIIL